MALKKDKEKVIDPVWGEERIREFLSLLPPAGENADHHKLLRAYQSMRAEDFKKFVGFFIENSGDINARNNEGKTVLEIIQQHRYGKEYADTLVEHGAGS